jgi:hypothetical protein
VQIFSPSSSSSSFSVVFRWVQAKISPLAFIPTENDDDDDDEEDGGK